MNNQNEASKRKNPCYKCQDRTPGCHGPCERYAGWKQDLQEFNTKIFQEKCREQADSVIIDGFKTRKQKWKRSFNK